MTHDLSRDTEQVRRNWRKRLGAFVLVTMLGCLVVAIWVVWQLKDYEPFTATDYYPSYPDSYGRDPIEGNAAITLPPSAHEIYAYTTGFQDIFIAVRFSMSANELDDFIESILCQGPLMQMNREHQSPSEKTSDWWTPDQAEHLEGCTGRDDHSHQTIMVDMTNPDVYIVFVSTSTY